MSTPQPTDSRSAWVAPGVEDVGNGVYRIPLPLPNDGLRAVNVYVLPGSNGLTLVDGGWALAESVEQLQNSLRQVGFGLDDIEQFLVTHIHRDHYTQAVALRREIGAKISLGAGEQPNLNWIITNLGNGEEHDSAVLLRAGASSLNTQLVARGRQGARSTDWEPPDIWLADRTEVAAADRILRVISTPGHTAGHVVYHDAQANQLFAGDHVLPQITPSIGFEPVRVAFPLRDYLDSLRLMFSQPDAMLLPAHGPVTASVHERVTELLAHHEDRLSATASVVVAGAATALDAAHALTWTRHKRSFEELDLLNQVLATAETAAHLDVLVLQGRLTSSADPNGIEIYQS